MVTQGILALRAGLFPNSPSGDAPAAAAAASSANSVTGGDVGDAAITEAQVTVVTASLVGGVCGEEDGDVAWRIETNGSRLREHSTNNNTDSDTNQVGLALACRWSEEVRGAGRMTSIGDVDDFVVCCCGAHYERV